MNVRELKSILRDVGDNYEVMILNQYATERYPVAVVTQDLSGPHQLVISPVAPKIAGGGKS